MLSKFEFKKCEPEDIDTLIRISNQFYPEHYSHIWENEDTSYYINLSFTRSAFEKDLKTDNIIYYLIQNQKKHFGLLKLRTHQPVYHFTGGEALQLEKIYLLKESTGLGIGKMAMEFTKEQALLLGKKIIWLDVMTTSPALKFYQKMGFKTNSYYHLDYPGLKNGYQEMQRMILELA